MHNSSTLRQRGHCTADGGLARCTTECTRQWGRMAPLCNRFWFRGASHLWLETETLIIKNFGLGHRFDGPVRWRGLVETIMTMALWEFDFGTDVRNLSHFQLSHMKLARFISRIINRIVETVVSISFVMVLLCNRFVQ